MAKIFFVSLSMVFVSAHGNIHKSIPTECTSKVCYKSGKEILNYINNDVKPCDGFYEHTCGGWSAKHSISEFELGTGQFELLIDETFTKIQELLEVNDDKKDIEAVRKAKKYYRLCTDLEKINRRGLEPIETILKAIGGWPLMKIPIKKGEKDNIPFFQIHENLAKATTISSLFLFGVKPDDRNSSINVLYLYQPEVESNQYRFLLRKKLSLRVSGAALRTYIFEVAKALHIFQGVTVDDAKLKKDVFRMLVATRRLRNIANVSEETDGDIDLAYMTIQEVQQAWDKAVKTSPGLSVDWLNLMRGRFADTGIDIKPTDVIEVAPGNYVEFLAQYFLETPAEDILNYMHWTWAEVLLLNTNNVMDDIYEKFTHNLLGTKKNEIWQTRKCIQSHPMEDALSYLYVRKYFNRNSLPYAINMTDILVKEFRRGVRRSTWLRCNEKKLVEEKLDNMIYHFGYPDWYDDDAKVNEYYKELTIGSQHFENFIAAKRFTINRNLKKLRQPVTRNSPDWPVKPLTINAAYDQYLNAIHYPAAMMQMPLFNAERPAVLNYGGIGALLGHEITHGFDNTGRKYNKFGNKRKWWSEHMIEKYEENAQCFIDQYDKYEIAYDDVKNETIYVNGRVNEDENIADNLGFLIALRAYRREKEAGRIPDVVIPALRDFTDEQLYFYTLANVFCIYVSPEDRIELYMRDNHSPRNIRIDGSFSNMVEFAKAFGCSPNSPLNPKKKCTIWN